MSTCRSSTKIRTDHRIAERVAKRTVHMGFQFHANFICAVQMSLDSLLEKVPRPSEFDPCDYEALREYFPPPLKDQERLPLSLEEHSEKAFRKLHETGLPTLQRADEHVRRRAEDWFERVTQYAAKQKAADQVLDLQTLRFRLTRYSTLKGCGCKVPQSELLEWMTATKNLLRSPMKSFSRPGGLMSTSNTESSTPGDVSVELGVGMDASVVRLTQLSSRQQSTEKDAENAPSSGTQPLYLISTTDFFFPLVEDPYLMGRIAAANVLSDAYALGIRTPPSTMLMLVCAATEIEPPALRAGVIQTMMAGFIDACHEAGTQVTGGQTTLNPWPLIGGVAEVVLPRGEFLMPDAAQPGDTIVLTKPLGTQVAINLYQWLGQMEDAHYLHLLESLETTQQQEHGPEDTRRSVHGQFVPPSEETHARDIPGPGPAHTTHDARLSRALSSSILEQLPPAARKTLAQGRQARVHYSKIEQVLTPADICRAYDVACLSMAHLNARAAQLLLESGAAHAVTDITGFGILGHAQNLARNQKAPVDMEIDVLPIIRGMTSADRALQGGKMFRLLEGFSAETSGGLLICFGASSTERSSQVVARQFCEKLATVDDHWPAWIVGRVVPGSREARILDHVKILEV